MKIKTNIWRYPTANNNGKSFHPAPFPFALARDHILSWSNVGDLILDPMAGSGTTLKAAKQLERKYIGFEVSQEYVTKAIIELINKSVTFPGFNNNNLL